MTLTEFLLARIAEDDEAARAEVARHAGSPRHNGKAYALRMARECEAKRLIVGEHAVENHVRLISTDEKVYVCRTCEPDPYDNPPPPGPMEWPCPTLRFLALTYADHPDYQEDWRP